MVHPATRRSVLTFWRALQVDRLAIGLIQPGQGADDRGRGIWIPDLDGEQLLKLLPRAAAANCAGSHVYVRLSSGEGDAGAHPGVILLDDAPIVTVKALTDAGFAPAAVVETSPGNFQAWLRLIAHGQPLTRGEAQACVKRLAATFQTDPRAVSPVQPGRLPGFTNRKSKYGSPTGAFPFVRLIEATGATAPGGPALLAAVRSKAAQGAGTRGAPPETPPAAAVVHPAGGGDLDQIRATAARRIDDQVRAGTRPPALASASEVDWHTVRAALRAGHDPAAIIVWLEAVRPDHATSYATRTVARALASIELQMCPTSDRNGP